jgi:hypothetical protein
MSWNFDLGSDPKNWSKFPSQIRLNNLSCERLELMSYMRFSRRIFSQKFGRSKISIRRWGD